MLRGPLFIFGEARLMDWKRLLTTMRIRELLGGEKSISDSRTEFERDYGRAAFSTPVRRLQDKTQVFPLEEHDAVRTRLTHSLEVSSVARNLAREVGLWLVRKGRVSDRQGSRYRNDRRYVRTDS